MQNNLYDVYLSQKPYYEPNWERVLAIVPPTQQADLRRHVTGRFEPRYLGLDLAQQAAEEVLELLRAAKAHGESVPVVYREAKVSPQDALPRAEAEIQRRQVKYFPGYAFEPVLLVRDDPRWWTFAAGSPQLQNEGLIPGAVFAHVDKLDGHLWQDDEIAALFSST